MSNQGRTKVVALKSFVLTTTGESIDKDQEFQCTKAVAESLEEYGYVKIQKK